MRKHFWILCVGALLLTKTPSAEAATRLINGKPVEPGTYKEVVNIKSGNAGCTATVVGPRVIATAAHCARDGATATFSIDGTSYSAKMSRSPLYIAGDDHDIGLGVTSQEITGIEPASIGGTAETGLGITLLGYGCTQPGGTGGNDGILRIGQNAIISFSKYDMVSRMPGGAALCYGDSGGPAFVIEGEKHLLIGINSKGNIEDTNYNLRTDVPESQNFIKTYAQSNSVEICGINKDCSDQPEPEPTCILKAYPQTVKVNETVTLTITTEGKVDEAMINGSPVTNPTGQSTATPTTVGNHKAHGMVKGPGGQGHCETSYTAEDNPLPPAPTCTLTAIPDEVILGNSVTLEINTQGQVTSAYIENESVSFPTGEKIVTPTSLGTFTAPGRVQGPGGAGNCSATYTVVKDGPNPSIPNFAAVPAYCGQNTLGVTQVRTVCVAVLKKDPSLAGLRLNKVILVQFANGSKEVLPILGKKQRPADPGDLRVKDDLILYANDSVPIKDYMVLDTRKAVLTKIISNNEEIPTAIEGRTATGQYFIVDNLQPLSITF